MTTIPSYDGMVVIPPNTLSRKIIDHLSQSRKAIEESLVKSLNSLHHLSSSKHFLPYIHFDTEAARLYLELCTFRLLHSTVNVKDAIKGLCQYHSISTVYHLPLCENFMSHINTMIRSRRKDWERFRSSTMERIISYYKSDEFDFLKLWEQASIAELGQTLHKCLTERGDHEPFTKATLAWLNICNKVIDDPLECCYDFFYGCLPQLLELKQDLSSIICAVNIHCTILLTIISCMTSKALVFPHVYARSLSVYESLVVKTSKPTILSACFRIPKRSNLLPRAIKLLQQALDTGIHSLLKTSVLECDYRQSLILILTLFTNFIVIQPVSSHIRYVHLALKQELANTFTYKVRNQAISSSINKAKSTSDYIKIIEYLLSLPQSKSELRCEAMATLSKTQERIVLLSDVEVKTMSPVVIKGYQEEITPDTGTGRELVVSPLLPEVEIMKRLYFQVHYHEGRNMQSTRKPISDDHEPPWMKVPANCDLSDPDITEFLDLGFPNLQSQSEAGSTYKSSSVCQICKVRIEEDHNKSDRHARNLALYKQFLFVHDIEYTRCVSEFQLASKSTKPDKQIKIDNPESHSKLLKCNKLILSIYTNGEWEKGINLIRTHCIPAVRELTKKLST